MAWNEYFRALRRVKGLRGAIPIICIGTLYYFFWGLVSPIFNIRINEITGSLALSGIIFAIWPIIQTFMDIKVQLNNQIINPTNSNILIAPAHSVPTIKLADLIASSAIFYTRF